MGKGTKIFKGNKILSTITTPPRKNAGKFKWVIKIEQVDI